MAQFELSSYLDRFPKVCQTKFRRTYNFSAVEKRFDHLRRGQRHLAAKDVMFIFDPVQTPFGNYWMKPNEKDLDMALRKERVALAPLPKDQGELVRRMVGVFHSIGVVSLVLRFVHPEHFGVFSTPVLHLLQVQRPSSVELFLVYCQELEEWRKHFRLASVAETEMALWTYDQIARDSQVFRDTTQARRDFESDLWVQRQRAKQVLRPLLKRGRLELARILVYEDPNLAGKIAAEEYERMLRAAARRYYRRTNLTKRGADYSLIEDLARDGFILPEEKIELQKMWETRNQSVHPDQVPSPEAVELMIDGIERICGHWEKGERSQ